MYTLILVSLAFAADPTTATAPAAPTAMSPEGMVILARCKGLFGIDAKAISKCLDAFGRLDMSRAAATGLVKGDTVAVGQATTGSTTTQTVTSQMPAIQAMTYDAYGRPVYVSINGQQGGGYGGQYNTGPTYSYGSYVIPGSVIPPQYADPAMGYTLMEEQEQWAAITRAQTTADYGADGVDAIIKHATQSGR